MPLRILTFSKNKLYFGTVNQSPTVKINFPHPTFWYSLMIIKIKNGEIMKTLKLALVVGLCSGLITQALARNGFIPHYTGTEGLIGGSGTALPLDCSSTIANPAALGALPTHFLIMGGVLRQNQSVDSSQARFVGNPTGKLNNNRRNLSTFTGGFNYVFNPCWAAGFAITGGGGFVRLPQSFSNPFGLQPQNGDFNKEGVNAIMLSATSIVFSPTPAQHYGISLLIATSNFNTNSALPPPNPPIETKGHNKKSFKFGVGTRIGGMWDVCNWLTLGASAATPVYFDKHKKYSDLLKHHMEIPGTARLGLAVHFGKHTDFAFDLKWLFYGKSKWLTSGLGWHNQFIILTGIQHWLTPCFALGIGLNHAKPPIRKSHVFVNSLFIPIEKTNFSGGFRYKHTDQLEILSVLYYTPPNKMTDNGKLMPLFQGTKMKAGSYGIEFGIRYDF
jgi:long-subunit fatty acid transport protein